VKVFSDDGWSIPNENLRGRLFVSSIYQMWKQNAKLKEKMKNKTKSIIKINRL
jgi:hypothetical protein